MADRMHNNNLFSYKPYILSSRVMSKKTNERRNYYNELWSEDRIEILP